MRRDEDAAALPALEDQIAFWDLWNQKFRREEPDEFMSRQRDIAIQVAHAERLRDARILDVGCGTGWLGHSLLSFGEVTGTDLSPSSIERGRRLSPGVNLQCGDFLKIPFNEQFDFVVSADVISHVYNQRRFVARVAELLRPGGIFLLMTQNAFVWNRSSRLMPAAPGQIRNWPSLRHVHALLRRDFRLEHTTSIVPGGDRGVLRWVNSRFVSAAMRRLLPGRDTWGHVLERARVGRELVYIARRR